MKLRFVGAGAALVLTAISGCGSEPARSGELAVGATTSAVQGGQVDQTHAFAVGVCGGGKGNCQLICSGALIAPNLVVTARHCVDNISNPKVDCTVDTFGAPLGQANQFWITTSYQLLQFINGWHQVSKIITPPGTRVCGNDIALLILTANVPASEAAPIAPGIAYPMTDHTHYSTSNTAIGYGMTQPSSVSTAGTRHIRQNIGIQCIPGDKTIDDCTSLGSAVDAKEFVSGDGTCEGDSGSSAYEQQSFNAGKPVSLGVLSRGGVSLDGLTCISAVYTRLDAWKDLLVQTAQQAAQQGGYTLPVWAGGTDTPPPSVDAGADAGASTGQLGGACGSDDECDSKTCRNYSGGPFLCTEACDASNACPKGYSCAKGFCFPATDPGNAATTTTTTTGCAIGRTVPSSPFPWRELALGLAAVAMCMRRRRETGRRFA
jgi:hypothetical protein